MLLAGTVAPVGNVELDPENVVRRMLTVCGVHNYHPRDLEAALTFLAGPGQHFPFETLLAASYPLEQADQAFHCAHTLPGVRVVVVP
jgi:alcohol dehydrogenase